MKVAILQVADTGPLESLVVMLRSAGYACHLPDAKLRAELRSVGCDTVLDIDNLVRGWGYDRPFELPEANIGGMERASLYVDIKGHRAYEKVVKRWPNLSDRVLWYRIQGGMPEHVINERGDHGDEVNPPCPVLTPNLWYENKVNMGVTFPSPNIVQRGGAYACWPPFVRFDDYFPKHGRWKPNTHSPAKYAPPICLIHGINGWGYGTLIEPMRNLGVRFYGTGSPDGLIQHSEVPAALSTALCMVHLKSSDAPGYSLYEALAAACPVVCTRRLIWRCRMESLLVPGVTCLVFDRETHDPLTADDVRECSREVRKHLERLSDPVENQRIGLAGRERLRAVMWNEQRDGDGLRSFMGRHFPR